MIVDEHVSERIMLECGIDQGCPLSAILFQFCNAALLQMVDEKEEESAVGYVDDVAAITVGKDFQESNNKMKDVMERPGGGFELARQRGLEFAVEKFAVILCSRKREPAEGQPRKTQPITCPDLALVNRDQHYQISPSVFARFLGLLIDQELRFKEQTAQALKKGMVFIGAFRRLIKMTRGTSAIIMRRFYLAIAVPRMLYAASVFLFPPPS
ncbi:hypothetical protein SISNIDRAFT_484865 [Sistotremastrum niveocremeum HHB9708]|uniref:Reverse transcriptase domain-containing protein n=1 Tax=Sistotremastrum niveocremeum HHB9708 TaxID=1314777 RepID=A0A164W1E3_9AGAM|nr:hypothetical protein SISNIDRAFT_484865 [Sistotremastrum niveocremeum HHB9708]